MYKIERSFSTCSVRKCFSKSISQAFVIFICMYILYTLRLVSKTVGTGDIITVGPYSDQFLIPDDQQLGRLSDIQLMDVFTKYINSFQIMCRNHKRIGVITDGGKEVCVDEIIRPRSPCLVYSFGSNNKFDFEYKLIKQFGCEVLTFDPTMGSLDRKDMRIPNSSKFYEKGLEGVDMPEKNLFTLGTILQEYGHSTRTLDLLKVDVEGSEWSAFEEMMTSGTLANVRQLLVEFHFDKEMRYEKIRQLRVLRKLYDYGFRSFSRERNLGGAKFYKDLGYSVVFNVEISMVNIRFL
ncbi:uncharacterized protein LOC132758664 [Ruditapes philippinarum]|uniref:uncharacterized protein LOC132758664 n=1 Tax=Ruditapes philippinarum TaxID=129788 RepID=UPI00295BC68C|nr:uncharacterized protein LOC132758664 [Ruditapes philippinarum]